MSTRLLLLSTYPAISPQHGGQKRTLALARAYRAAGFDVVQSAIYCASHYGTSSSTDIPVSLTFERMINRNPFTSDRLCGRAMIEDVPVRRLLERLLRTFRPDVVHVEQPYLYPGLRQLLIELRQTPAIVYGSQNIEAPMKRGILTDAGWTARQVDRYCEEIHNLEVAFSRECELVAACTPSDLEQHRAFGAQQTVLAPNGIDETTEKPGGADELDIADAISGKKIVLFIGSAHRPNLVGFRDLVGLDLEFLPDDARVVAVGGICNSIRNNLLGRTPEEVVSTSLLLAGLVTESQLRELIDRADVILLPISTGGGSNLKTAEAIAANRKIVTTSGALRSFEWFGEFPNVWVADTRAEFHDSIVQAIRSDYVERTAAQDRRVSSVYWENCLGELVSAVDGLALRRRSSLGES